MTQISATPLLDTIDNPADLRQLGDKYLHSLAAELRSEMIQLVSKTGGHLGAGLGVVELTIALHKVFNTPEDSLIWDVGHQAYPHKLLTGRRHKFSSLRQEGGISGFTRRAESIYDPFGAAHSSTSISAGLGMAVAHRLKQEKRNVVAVIGDGAMSAGMAFEALNNAGISDARLIVVLNDNNMSIAPPSGALSRYLSQLAHRKRSRVSSASTASAEDATLFKALGFKYVGPVNGHDLEELLATFRKVRDGETGPILVHVVTEKGKGYPPAEEASDKLHGVNKFDVPTGTQVKPPSNAPSYTKVFGQSLITEAQHDERIVGITAAMPSGTGLDIFGKAFPQRMFDVGIAEQHAVTFAAGMATQGFKPFVAIYSTFLQRALDQIIHDVAIQKLPVRFAIDRAGFVGADGPTHCGAFDIGFLTALPHFVVMAASDEAELKHMVRSAAAYDEGPIAFRYPRGDGVGMELPERGSLLEIGRGRIVKDGSKIALLSFGTRLADCVLAAQELDRLGYPTTVADARFAKPLDRRLIRQLAQNHEVLITVEEGATGGFGAQVLQFMAHDGLLDRHLKIRTLTMPDEFTEQAKPEVMYAMAGLDYKGISKIAQACFRGAAG